MPYTSRITVTLFLSPGKLSCSCDWNVSSFAADQNPPIGERSGPNAGSGPSEIASRLATMMVASRARMGFVKRASMYPPQSDKTKDTGESSIVQVKENGDKYTLSPLMTYRRYVLLPGGFLHLEFLHVIAERYIHVILVVNCDAICADRNGVDIGSGRIENLDVGKNIRNINASITVHRELSRLDKFALCELSRIIVFAAELVDVFSSG